MTSKAHKSSHSKTRVTAYQVFTPLDTIEEDGAQATGEEDSNRSSGLESNSVPQQQQQQDAAQRLKITNTKQKKSRYQLEIRPDDDVSSQYSTLTYYHHAFPSALAEVIDKRLSLTKNFTPRQTQEGGQISKSSSIKDTIDQKPTNKPNARMGVTDMYMKRIKDEVKMTIALKKVIASFRLNQRLVKAMTKQYAKLIVR